jgi:hypothetical protein
VLERTIGIIGYGRIGAERAAGLKCRVRDGRRERPRGAQNGAVSTNGATAAVEEEADLNSPSVALALARDGIRILFPSRATQSYQHRRASRQDRLSLQ